ncbi:MAG: trehalose-phosphatase [Stellaceae bacterium]
MAKINRDPPPPRRDWALFLDIDGTLLDLAPMPDAVHVPPPLHENLNFLYHDLGAVALVSGRSLAGIDALFAPLIFPAAGQHGAETRCGDERISVPALPALRGIAVALNRFAASHPGILVEDKGNSVAIHFRNAPTLEDEVAAMAARLVSGITDLEVLPAKMAFDIKPRASSKGDAIRWFLERKPFFGRVPVFVGDDRTDEAGFAAVNERGGYSIRVGEETRTGARFSLNSSAAVREWIAGLARYYRQTEGP